MLYTSHELSFKLTTAVVIGTDWIGSCKSNYHTVTVTVTKALPRDATRWTGMSIGPMYVIYNFVILHPLRQKSVV
jgi:hypothetical protein